MTTETEYKFEVEKVANAILRAELIEPRLPAKSLRDIFADIKKWATIGVRLVNILAKYFYVNGKLTAPSLLKLWKYFVLVKELYDLFKDIKSKEST